MGWNSNSTTKRHFNSGVPVWIKEPERYLSGFRILNKIDSGDKIAGLSAVEIDTENHTAKWLKCFKIKAKATAETNTVITVVRAWDLPVLKPGMIVMVMPNTLAGTGKAVLIESVDNSTNGESKISVPTADIDAIVVGGYLVESASETAGTGKSIYCIPANATTSDTYADGDNATLVVDVALQNGYAYGKRKPLMPDVVAKNLKGVIFDNTK